MFIGILAAAAVSAALGFGTWLMQVELFEQVNAFATTIAILTSTIIGIITYAISTFRKVKKQELTERDKWIMETMKAAQIGIQKSVEGIGRSKDVMQVLYEANLTPEQRQKIEAAIIPKMQEADQALQAGNEQLVMVKGKAVEIFGPSGDVETDSTVPREPKEISERLRHTAPTSKRDRDRDRDAIK
jgi:hypothetical protein